MCCQDVYDDIFMMTTGLDRPDDRFPLAEEDGRDRGWPGRGEGGKEGGREGRHRRKGGRRGDGVGEEFGEDLLSSRFGTPSPDAFVQQVVREGGGKGGRAKGRERHTSQACFLTCLFPSGSSDW